MLSKLIYFFLTVNVYFCNTIQTDEIPHSDDNANPYHLSICAIFKNKENFFKEWIDYHRDFGVDHFYLYNIGSRGSAQITLQPFIDEGIVTLIHWPEAVRYQACNAEKWALSTQIPAYENAVNFIARGDTKWLVFLDIHEFLSCSEGHITDLLKKYDNYAGISFSSDFFYTSTSDQNPLQKQRVQSSVAMPPPKQIAENAVAKMVFKPDLCVGFIWPPYQCRFDALQTTTEVSREELKINRYLNRNEKKLFKEKKSKCKQGFHHHNLSEAQVLAIIQESDLSDNQERPNTKHIQNILKKLRREMD